jgi:hypothetical protein
MKYYAGIGSRKTPENIMEFMKNIAAFLAKNDFILRSGGANGADSSFEFGSDQVNGKKEIFLPWKNFNNNNSNLFNVCENSIKIAEQFHPKFKYLKSPAKKLISRNTYQILGHNLNSPSLFVICYTENGEISGGTGQAIRIANHYNIPVFNLGNIKNINQNNFINSYLYKWLN